MRRRLLPGTSASLARMGWFERLVVAAVVCALFVPFYFLATHAWHPAAGLLVYAALAPGVLQIAVSVYERYDVRCSVKALGLRRALARGEIVLYYQPKVEIDTGEVVSAEALVRWEHPRRGVLLPAEFLAPPSAPRSQGASSCMS